MAQEKWSDSALPAPKESPNGPTNMTSKLKEAVSSVKSQMRETGKADHKSKHDGC